MHRFLLRLFLRDAKINSVYIIAPYISPMLGQRFTLKDLREKVERGCVSLYVITRAPEEPYQHEAMAILRDSPWIEVRCFLAAFDGSSCWDDTPSVGEPSAQYLRQLQVQRINIATREWAGQKKVCIGREAFEIAEYCIGIY